MTVKLPIALNASVTTECWTYYRLAIIEAYPHLRHWIAGHLDNVFVEQDGSCFFGTGGEKYNPMTYYSEALHTKALALPPERLEAEAPALLRDGQYLLLDCAREAASFNPPLHEILLYGCDTERGLAFGIQLLDGQWKTCEYSFEFLKKAAQLRREILQNDPQLRRWRSFYCAGATGFRARERAPELPPLQGLYHALHKAYRRSAYCYQAHAMQDTETPPTIFYEHILSGYNAVFEIFVKLLKPESKPEAQAVNLPLRLKKLYEYMALFRKRIVLWDECYPIHIPQQHFETLQAIEEQLDLCYHRALRYKIKGDDETVWAMDAIMLKVFGQTKASIEALLEILERYLQTNMEALNFACSEQLLPREVVLNRSEVLVKALPQQGFH